MIVFLPLLNNLIPFRKLDFREMNFQFFELFQSNFVVVTQIRNKAHQEIYFLQRNSFLRLCDYASVNIGIDLDNLCLFVFTCDEVVTIDLCLTEPKKGVLFEVVREFGLLTFNNGLMQLTSQQEVKIGRFFSLFVQDVTQGQLSQCAMHQQLIKVQRLVSVVGRE